MSEASIDVMIRRFMKVWCARCGPMTGKRAAPHLPCWLAPKERKTVSRETRAGSRKPGRREPGFQFKMGVFHSERPKVDRAAR